MGDGSDEGEWRGIELTIIIIIPVNNCLFR